MGAQFIHGQVGNPIYKIANENNLIPEIYQNIIAETDGKNITIKILFEK